MAPQTPFSTRLSGSAKETERRIRNIFQGPKKRPPIWLMALSAAAILSCGGLVSCQPEAETPPDTRRMLEDSASLEDVTLYEAGGMTIAFPNDIYDQLMIFPGEDEDTLVQVYEKASYEALQADYGEDARGGFLFEITRNSQAQYESFLMFDIPGQNYFAQDDTGYYCWRTPTDVQIFRSGEITDADMEEWQQINLKVEGIRDDFTRRNGLTPFDGWEIFNQEFVYEGEHFHASYSNWSTSMTLTLSQPVKQGEGGIWCVERWSDEYNSYLSFYMEGFPQAEGIAAAEHYQQLQAAADAGQRPELLDPRQAAVVWLQNYYRDTDSITVTLDDVTLLEENFGQAPPSPTPPVVSALPTQDPRTAAFAAVLENLYYDHTFPDGSLYDSYGSDPTWTDFAVYDVDGDGRNELILRAMDTYTAGHRGLIYDFDESSGTVREQFSEYPFFTFYDNGFIRVGWSHNQGWAGEFWPYSLYQYEPSTDSYQLVGMVDAWDKTLSDENPEALPPFPSELDTSGTGFLYYIYPAAGAADGKPDPVDASVYNEWLETYLGGASTLELPFMDLTEENIQLFKTGA